MKNPNLRRFSLRLIFLLLAPLTSALLHADSDIDRKIEDAAKSSYNFRSVLDNNVRVRSHDGVVTLTGTVLDADQKSLAEDTVRNLPGVTGVENHLDVTAATPARADGWIALKIRSLLLVRANVSAKTTDVAVRDGVVTLTGTATSLAQKDLTGAYAHEVEGVKSVKNNLQVAAPGKADATNVANATDAGADNTLREKIDDGSITAQVKYALLTHRSTSALKTSVETHNGAVVLRGEAGSAAEKDLVSHLVRQVRGVASVTNQMTVRAAAE